MEAAPKPIKKLLEGERNHVAPIYQRRYRWSEAQWQELWEGILEQAQVWTPNPADESGWGLRTDRPIPPRHFLGAVVEAPRVNGVPESEHIIIDGQQRLTTVVILLCVVRDLLSPLDAAEASRVHEQSIVNEFKKEDRRLKVLPTRLDRDGMRRLVLERNPGPQGGIADAYAFFMEAMRSELPELTVAQVKRIELTILNRLEVVEILVSAQDDLQKIFARLNGAGEPLKPDDLVRNHVLLLLGEGGDAAYLEDWAPIEEQLGDDLGKFLWASTVRVQPELPRKDLYRGLKRFLDEEIWQRADGGAARVRTFMKELRAAAEEYRRILEPRQESDAGVRLQLQRLGRWGTDTHHPLLLYLYRERRLNGATALEMQRACATIESFLVRRHLAGIPTNNLNRIFTSLIGELRTDRALDERIRLALSAPQKYWPDDATLRSQIPQVNAYLQGRKHQQRFIFERIEGSLGAPEGLDWDQLKPAYTIEHVMPQKMTEEWAQHVGLGMPEAEHWHSASVHTLANLTLTVENERLSNSPFGRKKEIYEQSRLKLNEWIKDQPIWDKATLARRVEWLLTRAASIWPPPAASQELREADLKRQRLSALLSAIPENRWTTAASLGEVMNLEKAEVLQALKEEVASGPVEARRGLMRVFTKGGRPEDVLQQRYDAAVLVSAGVASLKGGKLRAAKSSLLTAEELAAFAASV